MSLALDILSIVIGYLLGSIPTAYIVSRRRKGVDIRQVGSRNMGGGNVMREIGVWEGAFVGIADVAKGVGAILIARALNVNGSELWVFGAGFAALVGHNFPLFVGFRGGRGSATFIGIFLVLAPGATLITLGVAAVPFFTTRKFMAALLIGFGLLPLFIWLLEGSLDLVRYALLIDLFMLVRNLPDLRRVLSKGLKKDIIDDRQRKKIRQ
jgi:glycerol-3-phosphate acyltransferase PlsY